jgi:hypothetical protein
MEILRNNSEDFIDNQELHKYYYQVMEEYSETNIFNATINIMDKTFPDWKSHRGIGFWAAEFIYDRLENFNNIIESEDDDNLPAFKVELTEKHLTLIYDELIDEYAESIDNYKGYFIGKSFDMFEAYLDEERLNEDVFTEEEIDNMSMEDFNKALYEFTEKLLNQVVYNFVDEFVV